VAGVDDLRAIGDAIQALTCALANCVNGSPPSWRWT